LNYNDIPGTLFPVRAWRQPVTAPPHHHGCLR
jgi:hypothetical protein